MTQSASSHAGDHAGAPVHHINLPTGTVTFLFTDIEGSTELLQRLGTERFRDILESHNQILRDAIHAHEGRVPRTEGDAFFAVFSSATQAVHAAVDAQRALASFPWPEGVTLRVRMGMHSGEGLLGGDEYVGLDVHRAARVAGIAHGGQILLTEATRALSEQDIWDGISVGDLGIHRLKDIRNPEHLYQLNVDGLMTSFPPVRSLSAHPNNLPAQVTSFIGREVEIDRATRLLGHSRLLTLTGPGGAGKSRLAIQLGRQMLSDFPDGAFFVPLAAITDPELIPSVTLRSLGVHDSGSRPPRERLFDLLRDRRLLLILDNFEHIIDGAPLIGELLQAGSGIHILVTSRAALRISGEQELPIPPLPVPDPARDQGLEALSQFDSVRLFVARALAVKPDFQLTHENAAAVAAICARLDGLPLAIELAAARLKLLPPATMLQRLDRRLGLSGGSRDRPERQRTLRGAIAWSYDLLDDPSKRLFARLGVFIGGTTLEHAEAICSPLDDLGIDVLDGLSVLVEQSLLRTVEVDNEARFFMLETIREFALELLLQSEDGAKIHRRHAEVFTTLAEAAMPDLEGRQRKGWLSRLDREHGNLRVAVDWTTGTGETELCLRLSGALWRYWQMRGHLLEARERLGRALLLPQADDYPDALARAYCAAGGIAYWSGDMQTAQGFYNAALSLADQVTNRGVIADAHYSLSMVLFFADPSKAGVGAIHDHSEQALTMYRELNDRTGLGRALWGQTATDYYPRGKFAISRRKLNEAIAILRSEGDELGRTWTLYEASQIALRTNRLDEAQALVDEALALCAEARDVSGATILLDALSRIALAHGEAVRAARLAGGADALATASGTRLAALVNLHEARGAASETLGEAAAAIAWAEGSAMDFDMLMDYALHRRSADNAPTEHDS